MLLVCSSVSQLDFGQLMEIYRESNMQSGSERYRDYSDDRQLLEAEQDFYQFLAEFFKVKGAVYCIWSENGCYQSALRLEPYRDGLLLEGLETAPGSRNQGYAKKLLQETTDYLKTGRVYSHIDKSNISSQRTHISCGFVEISDCAVYINGSVDSHASTYMKICGA